MTPKERREKLKAEHKCVVCAADLPIDSKYARCFKCRVAQTEADARCRAKKKPSRKAVIKYFNSLIEDAEQIGSKFPSCPTIDWFKRVVELLEERGENGKS